MSTSKSLIHSRQIRAARALLDWSQQDLAAKSQVSIATIRKLEIGAISPRPATMQVIHNAIINGGLEFIEPGGVRYLPEDVMTYQGGDGLNSFLDDIYSTISKKPGDIITVCSPENVFLPSHITDLTFHMERMDRLKDRAKTKCILTRNGESLEEHPHTEYRVIPPSCDAVPFYVYGNKCALAVQGSSHSFKTIVVQSIDIVQGFRRQFQSMWSKAIPLMDLKKATSKLKA